jgi:hypothetical protein
MIFLLVFLVLAFYLLYISTLTGFFAVYYYDEKKYPKIKAYESNVGYFSHILFIAGIYFINIIVIIFYTRIIGMIIFSILIILAILFRIIVKKNMKNIIKITCAGIKPPATVIFNSKLLTILLSPFSNIIFIILIYAFIIVFLGIEILIKKYL